MSNVTAPSTPAPPPPAFKVNQEVILKENLRSPNEAFTIKARGIRIVGVRDLRATGNSGPVTSDNASYKLGMTVQKAVDIAEPAITSDAARHKDLLLSEGGTPSSEFYKKNAKVFLRTDWTYRRQGNTITLPINTRVIIVSSGATSKSGGQLHTTNTTNAYYTIALLKTETRETLVETDKYVPHDKLKKPQA